MPPCYIAEEYKKSRWDQFTPLRCVDVRCTEIERSPYVDGIFNCRKYNLSKPRSWKLRE